MELSGLQEFLHQSTVPNVKKSPKTFLGIAKQPHYENVMSNIYAFYFDTNEVHKLKDLFIKSLLELINNSLLAKQNIVFETFLNFKVVTEYGTKNQKRIDLLLQNNDQAIIIENKVYHQLNNDLDEYYNEIDVANKMGIVLSLHPIKDIKHYRFINITHLQLVSKVLENLGKYVLNANDKYLVFLKDFCQNIINLSHPIMEKDNIAFYYKNQEKINQLAAFKYNLRKHILGQVIDASNRIEGVNRYEPRANSFNDKRLVYYVSKKNINLMLTVVYEKLLTEEKSMYIAVEMQGDLLKDRNIYNQIDFTEEERKHTYADKFTTTKEDWAHFAIMKFHPTESDVFNLSDYIIQKLNENHLLSIFYKLNSFISKKK